MLSPMPFACKFCEYTRISRRLFASVPRAQAKSKEKDEVHAKSKPKTEKHLLKNLFPWKTKDELAAHLAANVIYSKDGLVAINKPYGIPLRKSDQAVGNYESLFAIEDILCPLANLLKENTLLPAKVGEKFSSGVSLFVTDPKITEKIQRCYRANRLQNVNTFTYQTITIGKPSPESNSMKTAMGFFSHKDMETHLPVIVKGYSQNDAKKQLVRLYNVNYETLNSNQVCSMVKLDVSSANKHFLRVFMAHCLAPILGDHLFGNRVQSIMGKRLAINPVQADTLSNFQKIPKNIMTSLGLNDPGLVPTCLHLSKIVLPRFSKDTNLELSAEPPAYFEFIMRAVGLLKNE